MKKKRKLLFAFVMIAGILLCIFLLSHNEKIQNIRENTRKLLYGDPIELSTGIVNNQYFGISSEGKNATQTTEGINKAIEYANKNNIEYLKFKEGTYLIDGVGQRDTPKGIIMRSNLAIDFNNATLKHVKNSSVRYSIINLHQVDNVEIKNAIMIGDKDEHDYDSINSTHEWGYGIEIKASTNVKLNHLKIENMTGDGILISDYQQENKRLESSNIDITNNRISNCRRQGITIGAARHVKIYQNEIYSIRGTLPAATIDLEPDNFNQIVDDIEIYDNKLYNANRLNAIQIHRFIQNVSIYHNEINGNLLIYECEDKITVANNKIANSNVLIQISKETISQDKMINKVLLQNNEITNSDMTIKNVKDILLENNKMIDTKLDIISSTIGLSSNTFLNQKNKREYAYCFSLEEGDSSSYQLYAYDNTIQGNYSSEHKIQETDQVTFYTEQESLEKYINQKFR